MGYQNRFNCTSQQFSGYDRLRVDPGQTGFFEGRMFRTYDKLAIAANGTQTYKFVAPINFILWLQKVTLRSGGLAMTIYDATSVDTGGWSALPGLGVNRMSERRAPFYTQQVTVFKGGTFTNGAELDYFELNSGTNQGNSQTFNVSADSTGERGLPATTFYMRTTAIGDGVANASNGVHSLVWEERPASVTGWNINSGVI